MKIHISIPITGQEATYEQRLDAAVEYVKKMYPKYNIIVTPKEVAERLEKYRPIKSKYSDYLLANLKEIRHCDAIFMCNGYYISRGCLAELAFADAIGITIFFQ